MSEALELYALHFRGAPAHGVWTANRLRGAFGSALKSLDEDAYGRFFRPTAEGLAHRLPSGLRDLPRPFVFRLREGEAGVNLFSTSETGLVCRVMEQLGMTLAASPELLRLPLGVGSDGDQERQRLRIRFLTPTELKGTAQPEFGVLMARIRDRISTLRALYGSGPLGLDFRAFGERADRIKMTRCELHAVQEVRLSKGTGQKHSLGGFTGVAEYEGPVAEFLPYLEAARWTGVGRQTVWGKGEITAEIIER
jgi:hypothetical protein